MGLASYGPSERVDRFEQDTRIYFDASDLFALLVPGIGEHKPHDDERLKWVEHYDRPTTGVASSRFSSFVLDHGMARKSLAALEEQAHRG